MKQKTINITPDDFYITFCNDQGVFKLIATDKNKRIQIRFERWSIDYLARDIHIVLDKEEESIKKLRQALKGDRA